MVKPCFRGKSDYGDVTGNAKSVRSEPGDQGENVARSGGNQGGRRFVETEGNVKGSGDAFQVTFVGHGVDGKRLWFFGSRFL